MPTIGVSNLQNGSDLVNYQVITTQTELDTLLANSTQRPVFLLKHSSLCSLSSTVWEDFQSFAEARPPVDCAVVRVVEHRELSLEAACRLGVEHKSPQLLVISNGVVVWHDSHWRLTLDRMREVANSYAKPPIPSEAKQ